MKVFTRSVSSSSLLAKRVVLPTSSFKRAFNATSLSPIQASMFFQRCCQSTTVSSLPWGPLLTFHNVGQEASDLSSSSVATSPSSAEEEKERANTIVAWWKANSKTVENHLPHEGSEVAVIVQTLAITMQQLAQHAMALPHSEREAMWVVVREMEAIMVFLVRTRLRYFAVVRVNMPADTPSQRPKAVREDDLVAVDRATEEANSLSLRRGARERVRDMVDPYTDVELLQIIVLVESIQAVLQLDAHDDAFAFSHKTKGALYSVAVTALSALPQLPPTTVAALATCMAACAESFAVSLQLTPHRSKRNSEVTEPAMAEERLAPSFFLKDKKGQSEELMEEVNLRKHMLGGEEVNIAVKPIEVLAHFSLLTTELTRRMKERMGRAGSKTNAAFCAFWKLCAGHNSGADKGQRTLDDNITGAAASINPHLSLRSLAERKAQQQQREPFFSQAAGAAKPKRKTIGDIASSSSNPHADNRSPELDPEKNEREHGGVTADSQLHMADAAEIGTAVAAARYLSDETFWHTLTRFAAWSAFSFAQELGELEKSSKEGENVSDADAQVGRFLIEMRDVAFALDFVQRDADYVALMEALVRLKFLKAVIPPPSAAMRGMNSSTTAGAPFLKR